ncbi:MAG: hypothetical protein BGO31_01235 [Bacteroidetes bacterium 43-16]|nr:MAG: hypothetical protein BGO31_01235 [Bacteroidetes bacterium 43-16]
MKNKLLYLLALLTGLYTKPLWAQNKIVYGIGLGLFQTKLNHVDRENFTYKGYSAPGFKQNDRLGFSAHVLAAKPLWKNISLETGVGMSTFRSQFNFNRETLAIDIYYLNIPLLFNYNIPLNPSSGLNVSLGANIRALLFGQDNYQDIIEEHIYLENARNYKQFIISPQFALGYSFRFNNETRLRISGNIGVDLQKAMQVKGFLTGWGFYSNLSTASYAYYGFSVNYFFSPKRNLG